MTPTNESPSLIPSGWICDTCGYSLEGLCTLTCPECGGAINPLGPRVRVPTTIVRVLAISVGGCAIGITTLAVGSAGVPEWWAPWPIWIAIPYFLSIPIWRIICIPVLFYALASIPLMRGRSVLPLSLGLIFGGLWAINLWHWWVGWSYGRQYQGHTHVNILGCLTVAAVIAGVSVWLWTARQRRWWGAYMCLILMFCASIFCLFPYLGELP